MTCASLAEALTAREMTWEAVNDLPQLPLSSNPSKLAKPDTRATTILAPTTEPPPKLVSNKLRVDLPALILS